MRRFNAKHLNLLKVFLVFLVLVATHSGMDVKAQQVIRKSLVEFYSSDSLLITADHYYSDKDNPYIILLHRENSSRGEFDSIAERFVKMEHNCLVVDLRFGNSFGFVDNETAIRAKAKNLTSELGTEKDIKAAIEYVTSISIHPVILLGSSMSAFLSLKTGAENKNVRGVMAFSPGEFFLPRYSLKDIMSEMNKPVYIACNPVEYPFISISLEDIPEENVTLIVPPGNTSGRGTELLMDSNPGYNEFWLSVLIFVKNLQN